MAQRVVIVDPHGGGYPRVTSSPYRYCRVVCPSSGDSLGSNMSTSPRCAKIHTISHRQGRTGRRLSFPRLHAETLQPSTTLHPSLRHGQGALAHPVHDPSVSTRPAFLAWSNQYHCLWLG